MIVEISPEVRWIERDGKLVLQYKAKFVPVSGDMDDDECIEYLEKNGEWRDVPTVSADEAEK